MRTSRVVLASVLLLLGCGALMWAGLKPAADFNPMRSIGRSVVSSVAVSAKVLQIVDMSVSFGAASKADDGDVQKVIRSLKSDKGVFYDDEEKSDIINAEADAVPEDKNTSVHVLARLQ